MTVDEIMWEKPLALISQLYARGLAYNGKEGIERPKNYEKAVKQIEQQIQKAEEELKQNGKA